MVDKKHVVAIGEVLWDVFPDGHRFGGAPANFACTAAGIGRDSIHVSMVSAVGIDELGKQALHEFHNRGVDTAGVEQLPQQTGQVLVQLDVNGKASYEFASDTAWDNLAWTSKLERIAWSADVICFGTLGQRNSLSQETIRRFVSAASEKCLCILDINLRPPYWTENVILASLPLANIVKLNDEELPIVAELLRFTGSEESLLSQLIDRYKLQMIALTRGSRGSILLKADGAVSDYTGEPTGKGEPTEIVDTVGAGDAFTAALAIGLLNDMPLNELHLRATQLAAFVCSRAGATPAIPDRFAVSVG